MKNAGYKLYIQFSFFKNILMRMEIQQNVDIVNP